MSTTNLEFLFNRLIKSIENEREESRRRNCEDDIFQEELAALLNKHSRENNSNPPDYILAAYLLNCLLAYESLSRHLDKHNTEI